jgi:hypothetical protein
LSEVHARQLRELAPGLIEALRRISESAGGPKLADGSRLLSGTVKGGGA